LNNEMARAAWVAMTRATVGTAIAKPAGARVDAGVEVLNEMTIGRTDDPENPALAMALEAASLFGFGSRNPSGPAASGQRAAPTGRTHDRNRPARQTAHFSLASEGPSTHASAAKQPPSVGTSGLIHFFRGGMGQTTQ
jgi:hypothetical protein